MISPRWRKVLRDAWLHRARTMLVTLAIAVGIGGAGAVLNAWALVRRATREGYLASNPASATLLTDSIDAALLARVAALPGIRDVQARRTVLGAARTQTGWATAVLYAMDDFTDVPIGRLVPEAGAWPPADGAMVIERSSLDFAGARVGEPMLVAVGDNAPVALPVTGVARDVGLAPGWMEHVVYGFVTRATLERLGAPSSLTELQLVVREDTMDRDAIRRQASEVKAVVEGTGRRVADVTVPVPGRHIHAGQMNSLLYTQAGFGLLALALSGFLVVNLVGAMLAGQLREIGVMKVLGARAGQIAALYLSFAMALGLLAAAPAIPLAAAVGRRYAALKAELLNFDLTGFGIPWWVIGLQLGVAALFPVVAAAVPVARGSRIGVGDALRDVGIATTASGGALLARVPGITRPLLLSLRNAFRKRQRMVLTLVALAMGGSVYLAALSLRAGVHAGIDRSFAPLRFDLTVRTADQHDIDSLESVLARLPGVAAAEAWSTARGGLARDDGALGNTFPILGLPPASRMVAPTVAAGRWLAPDDRYALVVNRGLLDDEPAVAVGATVTLMVAGRETLWTVVGVVERVPVATAYAPRATIAELLGERTASLVVVDGERAGDAGELDLIARLRTALGAAGFVVSGTQRLAESRRVTEDHHLMVADFLGVMAWLMIVVGGLGLASTMSLAVLERTREIGVLRAVGARHRSILTIVQVEALVIGTLSWALAIPVSLPMRAILGAVYSRIILPVPLVTLPAATALALWLGVVVVVSLATSAWPAVRALRVPTAAALAYE